MKLVKESHRFILLAILLLAAGTAVHSENAFLPGQSHASTLQFSDKQLLITFASSNSVMKLWNGKDHKLVYTVKADEGETLQKPVLFPFHGEYFLYVSTSPEGSGAFVTENVFWIAPDLTFHPVVFQHAGREYESWVKTGEIVLTGGPGIVFSHGQLRFEFEVARDGDPHCCPTGGRVTGTYKITGDKWYKPAGGYGCNFKIVVDQYNRTGQETPKYTKDLSS